MSCVACVSHGRDRYPGVVCLCVLLLLFVYEFVPVCVFCACEKYTQQCVWHLAYLFALVLVGCAGFVFPVCVIMHNLCLRVRVVCVW